MLRQCSHVFIAGDRIPNEILARVRPKPGTHVDITIVPQMGGGKKSPLRFILQLVVLAASFIVPALLPVAVANSVVFGTLTVGTLVGGLILTAGTFLINRFIPAPTPKLKDLNGTAGRDSPTLALQGIRNQVAPYGVVPRLYGKMRVTPRFGAKAFTEIRGKDQYLRVLFDLGPGPLKLSDHRIGRTPIEQFKDWNMEVREGWDHDAPLTLYTRIPQEEPLSIKLEHNVWSQLTTQPDADEISIDVSFLTGLCEFDKEGEKHALQVEFDVEYRPTGTVDWLPLTKPATYGVRLTAALARPSMSQGGIGDKERPPQHRQMIYRVSLDHVSGKLAVVSGGATQGGVAIGEVRNPRRNLPICRVVVSSDTTVAPVVTDEREPDFLSGDQFHPSMVGMQVQLGAGTVVPPDLIVNDDSTSVVRTNLAWKVDRDQYDVRIKRTTPDSNVDDEFDDATWTALRTFTNEPPVTAKGHALVAVEIRATDQLNGVLDEYNCIGESILLDFDGVDWVERPTSNHAAIYVDILMGSANRSRVTADRLYWPELQAWAIENQAKGREFNLYMDFRQSVREALALVARSARADFAMQDGRYSVVRDRIHAVRKQHITPRNSWGFRWRREFPDMLQGFRVTFKNRDKDWVLDERIVYFDGYSEANADPNKLQELEMLGVTDPDQVFLECRYREADLKLRANRYWCSMDFEHLVARQGSLVDLTHDVILVGIKAGRIKSLTLDVGNNVLGFVSDEALPMEPGKTYGVSIRTSTNHKVTRPVTLSIGENTTITFASPIPQDDVIGLGLTAGDLFGFGESGLETVPCLVKRITRGPDFTARLELTPYDPAVLDADEDPIPPFESKITLPSQFNFRAPLAPTIESIRSDEQVLAVQADGSLESRIVMVLARKSTVLPPAAQIKVRYRSHNAPTSAWSNMAAYPGDATIVWAAPVDDGVGYDLELQAVAADGAASDWTPIENHIVVGKSTPPADITTLIIETTSGRPRARWTFPDPLLDHLGFVARRLPGVSTDFDQGQNLSDDPITGTFIDLPVLDGVWTIMVKAIDTAGNLSLNPAVAIIDLGAADDLNILFERDYAAEGFPGDVTDGALDAGALKADDSGDAFWTNDAAPFWTNDNAPFWTSTYKAMSYIASLVPAADKLPARLRLKLDVEAAAWTVSYRPTGSQAPAWMDDSAPAWTSDSDPAWDADPDFVPWPGELFDVLHQEYEFRVNTSSGVTRGVISGFITVLDTEDVVEHFNNIAIAAGGTRLPLTKSFRQIFDVRPTVLSGGNAVNVVPIDFDTVLGPLMKGIDGNTPPNFVAATANLTVRGI